MVESLTFKLSFRLVGANIWVDTTVTVPYVMYLDCLCSSWSGLDSLRGYLWSSCILISYLWHYFLLCHTLHNCTPLHFTWHAFCNDCSITNSKHQLLLFTCAKWLLGLGKIEHALYGLRLASPIYIIHFP